MRTHRNAPAAKGDVIDVRSAVSGQSYGHIVVTDNRSTGRPVEGGHECRAATLSEVAKASAEGHIQVSYE